MQVSDLKIGHIVQVVSLKKGNPLYRQRLMVMGLTPGTIFRVSRIAPFGDPIQIEVRGFMLSLRKSEANILEIKEI